MSSLLLKKLLIPRIRRQWQFDPVAIFTTCFKIIRRSCAWPFLMAAATVTSMAQVPSGDAAAMIADARQRITLSQFPPAEQELRQLLALQPDGTEAHYLLGYTLLREGRATESLAEYTAGARLRTPTAEELTAIASDYILLKDLPDAEKWLLHVTVQDPSNAQAWYLLGRTQYNQDHAADAFHSFSRCLELRPRDVRAKYNLGLVYEKLQRPADAIAAYQAAIDWQSSVDQPDPQPYLDLGILPLRQSEPAKALNALSRAVDLSPNNALAHQELGLALEALGHYDQAIVALKRAAALAPSAEQPHFFLGRIFRHLGRSDEATAEYAAVTKILGSHSDTATPNSDHQP